MGIVGDIVDGAIDDNVKLATLLRKLLIVGERLQNDELKTWVLHELNGYDGDDQLPPYRQMNISAKGVFVSIVGQMNDQPLQASVMQKEHQWWATSASLLGTIASLETLVVGEPNGRVMLEWPADLVAFYSKKFSTDWHLNRAWQEIPINAVNGLLDTVRTRILQFALELQKELGDAEPSSQAAPPEAVNNAVQTIIYGGNNIISPTIAGNVQFIGEQTVVQGDFFSLSSALSAIGVDQTHVTELESAISADKAEGADKGYGEKVKGWLAKAGTYVATEGGKAAVELAKNAATKAVMTYLGMPPA
ncbi:AbiTii domain-containing protein [Sphingomonas sp. ERG5]|uniref:AbiTii domain-containing protein n=1 Tax=Sphingomonas sp. ERG5 TaxID=1381597 RepID=UPI00054C56F4|nr:hypothetical protein [Sphingomonas sp. ERG5]